jgi:ABC-type proline/glycine betaine transport system permease subunit
MGSYLEYMAYSWDHVLELAIEHAIVVAISLAIAVAAGA